MREVESAPKGTENSRSLKTADSRAKHNSILKRCIDLYQVNNWQWEESSKCQRESKSKFDILISGKPFLQGNRCRCGKAYLRRRVKTTAENLPADLGVCALL